MASVISPAAASLLARALAAAAAALPVGIAAAVVAVPAAPSAAVSVLTVRPAPVGEELDAAAPFVVGVVAVAAGVGVGDAESVPLLAPFGSRLRG